MRAAGSLASASKMDVAVGFSPTPMVSSEVGIKPRFCVAGCVKCAPVSLALRSNALSSSMRSECSSSPLSSTIGNSFISSSSSLATGIQRSWGGHHRRRSSSSSVAAAVVKSILVEERGASKERFSDTSLLETLRDFIPLLESKKRGIASERVEALNRIEEFKSALARKVTHYISFLVFAVTYNAGCTFFDSNASTDCSLRAL
jgi:hypothetical protein